MPLVLPPAGQHPTNNKFFVAPLHKAMTNPDPIPTHRHSNAAMLQFEPTLQCHRLTRKALLSWHPGAGRTPSLIITFVKCYYVKKHRLASAVESQQTKPTRPDGQTTALNPETPRPTPSSQSSIMLTQTYLPAA